MTLSTLIFLFIYGGFTICFLLAIRIEYRRFKDEEETDSHK